MKNASVVFWWDASNNLWWFLMHLHAVMWEWNSLIMVRQLSISAVLWKVLGARGLTVTRSEEQILCKWLLQLGEDLTYLWSIELGTGELNACECRSLVVVCSCFAWMNQGCLFTSLKIVLKLMKKILIYIIYVVYKAHKPFSIKVGITNGVCLTVL